MRNHEAGRPGAERNISRARDHNVIRDRSGFVISDFVPDLPPGPLSDLRNELARMQASGKYDNPRLDFLAFGERYPKKVGNEIKMIEHGRSDNVGHISTSGKPI